MAISLMTGVVTAVADAWVCAQYGADRAKTVGHMVMRTAFGLLGAFLYWE